MLIRPSVRPAFDGLNAPLPPSAIATEKTTQPDAGFVDLGIQAQHTTSWITPGITAGGDCFAVGLHGPCRPGQVLVVAPIGMAETAARLTQGAGGGNQYQTRIEEMLFGQGGLPGGVFIVRPGETVRFGSAIKDGIACYSAILNGAYASIGLPVRLTGGQGLSGVGKAPGLYSLVRVYRRDPGDVEVLNYLRVPYVQELPMGGVTANPIDGQTQPTGRTLRLPVGTRQVMVQIVPTDSQVRRYALGVSNTFDIGWSTSWGVLNPFGGSNAAIVHNQADDFDNAGRGAVDNTHDVEVYDVPSWANGIYVGASATLSQAAISAIVYAME